MKAFGTFKYKSLNHIMLSLQHNLNMYILQLKIISPDYELKELQLYEFCINQV